MFGINSWEFIVLAVVALLVIGPDKLPGFVADARRMIKQVRRMADDARNEVTRELGPEFQDISLSDLNPRSFVKKHLFDDEDLDLRSLNPFADDEDDEAPARDSAVSMTKKPRGSGVNGANGANGSVNGVNGVNGASGVNGSGAAHPARPPYDPDAT